VREAVGVGAPTWISPTDHSRPRNFKKSPDPATSAGDTIPGTPTTS